MKRLTSLTCPHGAAKGEPLVTIYMMRASRVSYQWWFSDRKGAHCAAPPGGRWRPPTTVGWSRLTSPRSFHRAGHHHPTANWSWRTWWRAHPSGPPWRGAEQAMKRRSLRRDARGGRRRRCLRLRLRVQVEAGTRRRGSSSGGGGDGDEDGLVGPRRLRGHGRGRRGGEVLPGEAGPPRRRARGSRPGAGAAQPAGGVAYASEDGVELLDLGVGGLVDGDGGGGGRCGIAGDVGVGALALGGGRGRVHRLPAWWAECAGRSEHRNGLVAHERFGRKEKGLPVYYKQAKWSQVKGGEYFSFETSPVRGGLLFLSWGQLFMHILLD